MQFFFCLGHILILLIVLCPLKCWELLQDGGAESFPSSFCACCDVAGLRVGVYQANAVLWQSSLLPGQVWEDRGSCESTVCPASRVGSGLSLLFLSHSEPLLGYYKPDARGVVLESEIGSNRKKV